MEIGPFRVKEDKLLRNEGAWNKYANLLFVDQPIGVGFSISDTDSYIHELPEMAEDMITFLDNYFTIFPEQQRHEIYIAGESYAGQYIPYLADAINKRNKNLTDHPELSGDLSHINLKGLLIGNGWIDPATQYLSYVPFAYQSGLVKHGSDIAAAIEQKQRECVQSLSKLPSITINNQECDMVLDTLLQELFQATKLKNTDSRACVNIYDVRLTDTFSSCGMNWPPDLMQVTPFLRRPEVLTALNIGKEEQVIWKECSGPVGQAFKAKNSVPSNTLIPGIIASGVEVLMFNGDQDLICNHVGNSKLIQALSWGGDHTTGRPPSKGERGGFKTELGEVEENWYVNGTVAGTFQSGRNLTYVKIFNASHMVPFDVPEVSQVLLNQFIGIPGFDKESQSFTGNPEDGSNNKPSTGEDKNGDSEPSAADKEIEDATWKAYYRAGAVALVVVVLLTAGLVIFVWRNRRLMHRAMLLNESRPRGVHYEDGSRSGDSIDGFDDDGDRPAGFLTSLFAGMSRWNMPHHRRSLSRGNKYYVAGSAAGLGAAGGAAVPLTTFDKRDSLDNMLDSDDEEEGLAMGVGSASTPYSDFENEESDVPELVIERPANL